MSQIQGIQLNKNRILQVPLHAYENDFTFIVNGETFHTSKLISDLLSPTVCQMHNNDATSSTFTINTVNRGDFGQFLKLINFEMNEISESEIPFFCEVSEILGITPDDITDLKEPPEVNSDNIIERIRLHERFQIFYQESFERDIEFIASNFFSLCKNHLSALSDLRPSTIWRIITSEFLVLLCEDQLMEFIKEFVKKSGSSSSSLYAQVQFENVSESAMLLFVDSINFNDIDGDLWSSLSKRLKMSVVKNADESSKRYHIFKPQSTDIFSGIISYIKSESNSDISDRIIVTASTIDVSRYPPSNVIIYDDKSKDFGTENLPNSWLKFEFKDSKVIPSSYQIMSYGNYENARHPKSWVIEGSNDDINWEILDEKQDCEDLNGLNRTQIFQISNENSKKFSFIRMRMTGPSWYGCHFLYINSFEIYGTLS